MAAVGVCLGFDLGGLRPREARATAREEERECSCAADRCVECGTRRWPVIIQHARYCAGIRLPSLVDTRKYRRGRGMPLG